MPIGEPIAWLWHVESNYQSCQRFDLNVSLADCFSLTHRSSYSLASLVALNQLTQPYSSLTKTRPSKEQDSLFMHWMSHLQMSSSQSSTQVMCLAFLDNHLDATC